MADIKTKIEDISSIKKKIEVTIPVEAVREALEKEYDKISKSAKIKGFRKGKVPRNVLEKFYASEAAEGAMETLVRESYPEAVEKEMALPISAPFVEPGKFSKDEEFIYSATFEVKPMVKLEKYKGLNLEKLEVKVAKDEVDKQLEIIRQQMAQLEPVSEETKTGNGHVIIVDFKGTINGKPFKGSDAKDFHVELGAGNLLPQLEENMHGLSKGEEKEFDLDYPSDYFNKELAGKKGHFWIKVTDIKKKMVPELNDEFAKDLGDYKTLEDVRKDIEKRILEAKEYEAKKMLSTDVLSTLAEAHSFEIPESMINAELKSMFEGFVRYLKSQNLKFEDTGMKIEDFIDRYKGDAESRVRSFLVIDAIAEAEKIGVSDEDVEERFKLISQQANQPIPKVKQMYESQNLIEGLKVQIQHEKTIDFIIDQAKIKVKKPQK